MEKNVVEHRREMQPQVQLGFLSGAIEATVRYPVPLQRAAEIDERVSRELFDAIRPAAVEPAHLTAQPT